MISRTPLKRSCEVMTPDRVFVYGSLRKGASNHWRVESATFVRDQTITGTLLVIDWYPGLILYGETEVKGEVYEVSPELLKELDHFEGIVQSGEYQRVMIDEMWIYEWQNGSEGYEVVSSGDWLEDQRSDST